MTKKEKLLKFAKNKYTNNEKGKLILKRNDLDYFLDCPIKIERILYVKNEEDLEYILVNFNDNLIENDFVEPSEENEEDLDEWWDQKGYLYDRNIPPEDIRITDCFWVVDEVHL